MHALSIFVTDDGARAEAVRSLVVEWTKAGVLEPSIWVRTSGVQLPANGPPVVVATLIDSDGQGDVDLFSYVGRFRLDLIRVMVAHLIVDDAATSALKNAGEIVADSLDSVLPRSIEADHPGTRFHRTVLIIPSSGAGGLDRSALQPTWDANVVVSPEDRPDLDRSSVFVRSPGNYDGHAASAMAAVGGVVRGVGDGVVDELVASSTTGEGDVWVARISLRSIVGEDVIDALARRILDPNLAEQRVSAVVSWGVPASQPEIIVSQATNQILSRAEWAPTPLGASTTPSKARRGMWASIRTAVSFNLRTVGAVFSWTLTRGRSSIERTATHALVGQDSGVLVTLGPRVTNTVEEIAKDVLDAERRRLDEQVRYQATRTASPQPATWTRLRTIVFGLVDGGPLDDLAEPRQLGRRELLEPRDVVSPPGAMWTTLDGTGVGADDPAGMRAYAADLTLREQQAHAAAEHASRALEAARAEAAAAPAEGSPEPARGRGRGDHQGGVRAGEAGTPPSRWTTTRSSWSSTRR